MDIRADFIPKALKTDFTSSLFEKTESGSFHITRGEVVSPCMAAEGRHEGMSSACPAGMAHPCSVSFPSEQVPHAREGFGVRWWAARLQPPQGRQGERHPCDSHVPQ